MGESLLTRILNWLRAGYPSGIPQQDYLAVLGLLHRQLTVTEMDEIAAALIEQADETSSPIDRDEIERVVRQKTYQEATDEDIARVRQHLGDRDLDTPD